MKKKSMSNFLLVIIFLVGLSLLLYPTFSDWWNSMHQSRAIAGYADVVTDMSHSLKEEMYQDAIAYNDELNSHSMTLNLSDSEIEK